MKANQAYKADEEAVSPVVGVILMVAITVVLAAVVFVLVNNLGKGGENKPNIGFAQNSAARTLTITTADTADWNDIGQDLAGSMSTVTTCQVTIVGLPGASVTTEAEGEERVSTTDNTPVQANHVFSVTLGDAGETCTLALRHIPTNQSYGTWTFNF